MGLTVSARAPPPGHRHHEPVLCRVAHHLCGRVSLTTALLDRLAEQAATIATCAVAMSQQRPSRHRRRPHRPQRRARAGSGQVRSGTVAGSARADQFHDRQPAVTLAARASAAQFAELERRQAAVGDGAQDGVLLGREVGRELRVGVAGSSKLPVGAPAPRVRRRASVVLPAPQVPSSRISKPRTGCPGCRRWACPWGGGGRGARRRPGWRPGRAGCGR